MSESSLNIPEIGLPSSEAIRYANYILNHYSRNSYKDKLCLARDLERHGWKKPPRPHTKQRP